MAVSDNTQKSQVQATKEKNEKQREQQREANQTVSNASEQRKTREIMSKLLDVSKKTAQSAKEKIAKADVGHKTLKTLDVATKVLGAIAAGKEGTAGIGKDIKTIRAIAKAKKVGNKKTIDKLNKEIETSIGKSVVKAKAVPQAEKKKVTKEPSEKKPKVDKNTELANAIAKAIAVELKKSSDASAEKIVVEAKKSEKRKDSKDKQKESKANAKEAKKEKKEAQATQKKKNADTVEKARKKAEDAERMRDLKDLADSKESSFMSRFGKTEGEQIVKETRPKQTVKGKPKKKSTTVGKKAKDTASKTRKKAPTPEPEPEEPEQETSQKPSKKPKKPRKPKTPKVKGTKKPPKVPKSVGKVGKLARTAGKGIATAGRGLANVAGRVAGTGLGTAGAVVGAAVAGLAIGNAISESGFLQRIGIYDQTDANSYNVGDLVDKLVGDGTRNARRVAERESKKALEQADSDFKSMKGGKGPWIGMTDTQVRDFAKNRPQDFATYHRLYLEEMRLGAFHSYLANSKDDKYISQTDKDQAEAMWKNAMKARVDFKKTVVAVQASKVEKNAQQNTQSQIDSSSSKNKPSGSNPAVSGNTSPQGNSNSPAGLVVRGSQSNYNIPSAQFPQDNTRTVSQSNPPSRSNTSSSTIASNDDMKSWLMREFIPAMASAIASNLGADKTTKPQNSFKPTRSIPNPPNLLR